MHVQYVCMYVRMYLIRFLISILSRSIKYSWKISSARLSFVRKKTFHESKKKLFWLTRETYLSYFEIPDICRSFPSVAKKPPHLLSVINYLSRYVSVKKGKVIHSFIGKPR